MSKLFKNTLFIFLAIFSFWAIAEDEKDSKKEENKAEIQANSIEKCSDKDCLSEKFKLAKSTAEKNAIIEEYCLQVASEKEQEKVCSEAALILIAGNEKEVVKPDYLRAIKLLDVACNNKQHDIFAISCTVLASIYQKGEGVVKKDAKKAEKYLEIGCKKEELSSCVQLAEQFNRQGKLTQADNIYKNNLNGFNQACENNVYDYCYLLGNIYAKAMGVEKNIDKAMDFYLKSCKKDSKNTASYCYAVAEKLLNGEKIQQDEKKARELFKIACENGEIQACAKQNAK
ncbi:MAG: sel1 repeat family protein [Cardiobacteriaceae bacterium]|nr:sel1 repeat family protein [Cardiobacteriaceae bacterium]